jgi:hypothetical protein
MTGLKILFALIVLTMVAVTGWASTQCAIWQIPSSVLVHPWFIATLFDAYFGFLTFYLWVYYKESSFVLRVFWFVAIMLLGNMGMASYMLIQLFKLPAHAGMKDLLLKTVQ